MCSWKSTDFSDSSHANIIIKADDFVPLGLVANKMNLYADLIAFIVRLYIYDAAG